MNNLKKIEKIKKYNELSIKLLRLEREGRCNDGEISNVLDAMVSLNLTKEDISNAKKSNFYFK